MINVFCHLRAHGLFIEILLKAGMGPYMNYYNNLHF